MGAAGSARHRTGWHQAGCGSGSTSYATGSSVERDRIITSMPHRFRSIGPSRITGATSALKSARMDASSYGRSRAHRVSPVSENSFGPGCPFRVSAASGGAGARSGAYRALEARVRLRLLPDSRLDAGETLRSVPARERGHRGGRAGDRSDHDGPRLGAGCRDRGGIGQAEQKRPGIVLGTRRDARCSVDGMSRTA